MTRSLWPVLLVASMVLAGGSQGQAQHSEAEDPEGEAKAMFEAGRAAFADGRYETALERWQVAYGLSGRPALHYNLGLAFERLGRIDEAIASFEAYLKWQADGPTADESRGKLSTLRALRSSSGAGPVSGAPAPAQPDDEIEGAGPEAEPTGFRRFEGDDGAVRRDRVDQPAGGKPWYRSPYFWVGVGAVVVGLTVGIAVAASGDDTPEYKTPNTGVSIPALSWTGP
jgi:hypothetical protein